MSEDTTPTTTEETEEELGPEEIKEAEAAYRFFLPEAQAIPESKIVLFRADEILAYYNVQRGTRALLARKAELSEKFSAEEIAQISQAPQVALAVVFAHQRVERLQNRSPKEVRKKIKEASHLRKMHLLAAEANVLAGHLSATDIQSIKKGSGPTDLARDCIALADVFTLREDVLANRTPSTPALRKTMAKLGAELLSLLTPEGAVPQDVPKEELLRARDERDRLWTLLDARYDLMVSAAVRLVGRHRAEELVPPLQSRLAK